MVEGEDKQSNRAYLTTRPFKLPWQLQVLLEVICGSSIAVGKPSVLTYFPTGAKRRYSLSTDKSYPAPSYPRQLLIAVSTSPATTCKWRIYLAMFD
ncbi:MAG: hypothetical protein U0930_02245 [Pirellulales bacterium]